MARRAARGRAQGRAALPHSTARWISALIRMASAHPALEHVLDVVSRLSDRPIRTNFLLLGEPGTGKEGLARALHELVAPRAPLCKARVQGLDAAAQRAQLFAPRTGALERAQRGGLVLLDELCDVHPALQCELLDAIKAPSGPRLLAMSDRDPRASVSEGRLRHDLYYRVARIVLYLPPLRERVEDIAAAAVWMGNRILAEHRVAAQMRLETDPAHPRPSDIVLTKEAVDALQKHDWQGNFRELEAVLERALLLYRDDREPLTAQAVRRALSGPQ